MSMKSTCAISRAGGWLGSRPQKPGKTCAVFIPRLAQSLAPVIAWIQEPAHSYFGNYVEPFSFSSSCGSAGRIAEEQRLDQAVLGRRCRGWIPGAPPAE